MNKNHVKVQLEQAKTLIASNRRADAARLLIPIVKEDRDNIDAWKLIVQVMNKPEQKARALRELKRLGVDLPSDEQPGQASKFGKVSRSQASQDKRNPFRLVLFVLVILVIGGVGVFYALPLLMSIISPACPRSATPFTGVLYTANMRDWENNIVLLDPADPRDRNHVSYAFSNTLRVSDIDDSQGSWSPDGTQIVLSSLRAGSWLPDVYIGSADPSSHELCRVTFDGDNAPPESSFKLFLASYYSWGNYPRWSPDGTQIVFNSQVSGDFEVYRVDTNGDNRRQLTDSPGYDIMADWSPDGTQIVFSSERDGDFDLYVMDADGNNLRQLMDMPAQQIHPRWSPDGTRIAFTSTPCVMDNGCFTVGDILVYSVADESVIEVAATPDVAEFQPTWSPDGNEIIYVWRVMPSNNYLYRVAADGSSEPEELLWDADLDEYHPDWR